MFCHRSLACNFAAAVLAFAMPIAGTGCATKFVARPVNPLRPVRTALWDPGEISDETRARHHALGLVEPKQVLAALDSPAAHDVRARRAAIEIAIAAGMKAHAKFLTDRGAAGFYLCAAEHAFDARNQGGVEFRRFCREASAYAVARLASLREVAMENNLKLKDEVAGPVRNYRVGWNLDAQGTVSPDQFSNLVACDRYRIAGAPELVLVSGVGTPLAGKVQGPSGRAATEAVVMPDGHWVPLTATVEFGKPGPVRTVRFSIFDRKKIEIAPVGGRRETLAADFSTPFAIRTREINQQNFVTLGILGFLRGDQLFDRTGLYPIEAPSTDRIPVVFVHGLISDPNDWRFLHNALLADPEIRQKYQFWAFYYPTSMAVPWSATRLRQGLANARRKLDPRRAHPAMDRMVLVGHSMGGLLSRLQIVSGGEKIYHRYFRKPPAQLRLDQEEKRMVQDMFFFQPNPDIEQVVFICTPHQGSFLATNWVGKIGRMIARLPLTIIETTANIVTLNRDALVSDVRLQPGTSIDTLSPGGQFISILQELPMSEEVRVHSIIGDRGAGGDPWRSSDGVVPYWSSHIEGVPEDIIPSNHSGLEHKQCAEIIRRLLRCLPGDR